MLDSSHPRERLAAQRRATCVTAPIFETTAAAEAEAPCPRDLDAEAALIALLAAPRNHAITSHHDYAARERAVRAIVDGLAPLADLALARRVAAADCSDPLIVALARLNGPRRGRLIAYIMDSRRRVTKPAAQGGPHGRR